MFRYLSAIAVTALVLSLSGNARALEPTLEGEERPGWTSVRGGLDGNPVYPFKGTLTGSKYIREKFPNTPGWIVSQDVDGDGLYEAAVLFDDGTLRILSLFNDKFRTTATARQMAPASPPLVLADLGGEPAGGLVGIDGKGQLVSIDLATGWSRRLASGFSTLTYPVAADLDNDGVIEIAAVGQDGSLNVIVGKSQVRSSSRVKLLPDTRITVADLDGDGYPEITVFSTPTDILSPKRIGDDLEATGVSVFVWSGRNLKLQDEFILPQQQVFEMLTPVAVSEGPEGEGTVLMLSVTEIGHGTQIRSYTYSNGRLRERRKGPMTDIDHYIHILGGGVLGDSGRTSLLAAVIPADGNGDLELNRLDLTQTRVTLGSSVNTHPPASRLLDTALIGDFDSDGEMELLVPGKERSGLVLVSLKRNRLKERSVFSASGKVSTNLCPGDFNGDGKSDVIFGMDDGTMVILLGE